MRRFYLDYSSHWGKANKYYFYSKGGRVVNPVLKRTWGKRKEVPKLLWVSFAESPVVASFLPSTVPWYVFVSACVRIVAFLSTLSSEIISVAA